MEEVERKKKKKRGNEEKRKDFFNVRGRCFC
jgi:hypothetical protein